VMCYILETKAIHSINFYDPRPSCGGAPVVLPPRPVDAAAAADNDEAMRRPMRH
jgi:hypothetical protein